MWQLLHGRLNLCESIAGGGTSSALSHIYRYPAIIFNRRCEWSLSPASSTALRKGAVGMKRVITGLVFAVVLLILVGMMEEGDPRSIEALYQQIIQWITEKVQLVRLGSWR